MNAFDDRLRNTQRDVSPLVPRISLPNHKHPRLTVEKLTDFISAQVPHFGEFRNGVMPLGMHRMFRLY